MPTRRHLLRAAGITAASAPTLVGVPHAFSQTAQPPAMPPEAGRPGFFGAKDIAEAGLIYGLPIVTNYTVMFEFIIDRNSPQWKAPFNTVHSEARVFTPKDTAIVTPNSDTPYSLCWMDLRAEPIVLSMPPVDPKRYVSLQLIDGNTYNFGYAGTRTTGNGAGNYLVAGPDWHGDAPGGVAKVFRSTTQFALALFRTQLFAPDDLPNVVAVQAGYKALPLSAFLGEKPPPAAPEIAWPVVNAEMAKKRFFTYLDFALQFAPPRPNEAEIRAQLARIGVGAGPGATAGGKTIYDQLEVDLGLLQGERKLEAAVAASGTAINGWRVTEIDGSEAGYNGDWLARAAVAKAGIYANDTLEAAYPFTRTDSAGKTLDGSKADYTITFPPGQLPPANAFWSMTMYDGKTQLLVENPINRYLINAPMLPNMKRNADGGLTLYIQHKSPGAEKESNWLPAPAGPIYLVMRLYWPKTDQPSLLPVGKGAWQPPPVVAA